ncbi:hypothetical protein WM42_2296 [Corynebacterium simulans]|nr:hypothetical protein WM42_2296 [Corynebacterium simulans]
MHTSHGRCLKNRAISEAVITFVLYEICKTFRVFSMLESWAVHDI